MFERFTQIVGDDFVAGIYFNGHDWLVQMYRASKTGFEVVGRMDVWRDGACYFTGKTLPMLQWLDA